MNFWERNNFNGRNANFNGDNGQSERGECSCGANAHNGRRNDKFTEQDVRNKYEQYSGKSEDQLMGELAQTVARMKNDGSFDPSAIENMYATASPFLNEAQRERMRAIIDMLVR